MIRDQFRKFAEEEVKPLRPWLARARRADPAAQVIEHLAELGVFGLTIPEEFGGLGLGKEAMCVVTEELSRGYIGVGSLGTRTEIAGELIRLGGTDEQKAHWLPKLASGEILPDRRVHRAQHRLRPRLAHHPRRAQGRPLAWSPVPRPGSPTPPAPT